MSYYKELKLDPATGDLYLEADQAGAPIGGGATIEDADAVVQRLRSRLGMFKGSWFLDKSAGMAWYQEVFGKSGVPGKKSDPTKVNAALVDCILGTPGIIGFSERIKYDFNRADRTLSYSFVARSVFGALSFNGSLAL